MTYTRRLLVCVLLSTAVHGMLSRGMAGLPPSSAATRAQRVSLHIVPPPLPPGGIAQAMPLEPVVAVERAVRAAPAVSRNPAPVDVPTTERSVEGASGVVPLFGMSIESTSQAGAQAGLPIGNTLQVASKKGMQPPAPAGALAAPIPGYAVTKMPEPQGNCSGQYTRAATEAGLEGTVVLDLVVDENGRARDIKVVAGLAHGLTEAAVAALKACRFVPGEQNGKVVSVRLSSFKVRFVLGR